MRVQRICETIPTKSLKIAIHENLDPRKFSAIQYIDLFLLHYLISSRSRAVSVYLNGEHGRCGKVFIWNLQCVDGHPSVFDQEGEDNNVAVHGGLVCQCAVVFVKGHGVDLLTGEHAALECVCVRGGRRREGLGLMRGEMESQ